MSTGRILYAFEHGVYVIKLMGDVRLNLSAAFDSFQDKMDTVGGADVTGVFIDLTEAEGLDSTTLGLLAKISLRTQQEQNWMPTIISDRNDINRILFSMGFDQLFVLIKDPQAIAELASSDLCELDDCDDTEDGLKQRVLKAHKILMDMNDENRDAFKDLVTMLESGK